ncbi:uncharacterized protein TRUGW13939_10853 [Talaromyces rugulosus]|uniref:DUF7730 domain-containing protein n=1 Tax=Talaromyces rugulosus TaxID=121627 RepID=A0A7H8RB81_TALRU|nr:uncharacterized protein TRUGW13939_10853 [Talaromyces rugulosus]QKX63682.1 hypothetical protein TRUGW13939_10853 [Talaromyces rugulosus]
MVFYCATMAHQRRQEKAVWKDRKKNAPRQHPTTGNPIVSWATALLKRPKPTATQEDSPLFRLPKEIRLQIFAYVFMGDLHIVRLRKRLGYLRYMPLPPDTDPTSEVDPARKKFIEHPVVRGLWRAAYPTSYSYGIWDPRWQQTISKPNSVTQQQQQQLPEQADGRECLLSLLKTCKVLQDEATPLLYECINFEINSSWNAYYFMMTVPAEHLAHVRELTISLSVDEVTNFNRLNIGEEPIMTSKVSSINQDGWRRLWDGVSSMPRLRRLNIAGKGFPFSLDPQLREEIVASLKSILNTCRVIEIHIKTQH